MDNQSAFGKVPSGIGKRCKKMGVPAVAIVGGLLSVMKAFIIAELKALQQQ